jgi:aspartate aminotransferase
VEEEMTRSVEEIRHRRDLVVNHFRKHMPGIEFVEPLGGLHLLFRVDGICGGYVDSAMSFCERLLEEKGVLMVPGDEFGAMGWVRLSYAVPERELLVALDRVCELVEMLTGDLG